MICAADLTSEAQVHVEIEHFLKQFAFACQALAQGWVPSPDTELLSANDQALALLLLQAAAHVKNVKDYA